MWRTASQLAVVSMMLFSAGARAQEPAPAGAPEGEARRGFAGMARTLGEVTAVSGPNLTVKAEDGQTVTVVTTDNSRVMKGGAPAKVADLHVGDGLMAMGNLDSPNHTLHAAVVIATDAAQVKALKDNLGKTYITGRVTAIDLDNARMTVERSDRVSQVIGFDDSTSFKRPVRPAQGSGGSGSGGRGGFGAGAGGMMMGNLANMPGESITLADIKVGDRIMGDGSLKNGTFVPTHLMDMGSPGAGRRQRGSESGTSAPQGSSSTPPPAR